MGSTPGSTRRAKPLRQRPWHFLYFAPEPHQHGSLRPIRAPLGVNPGLRPPAEATAPFATGWSPSDSVIARGVAGTGPPRSTADPPVARAPAAAPVVPAPVAAAPVSPAPAETPAGTRRRAEP